MKNIFECGQTLSNGAKVLSVVIAFSGNLVYFLLHRQIMDFSAQQSLLFFCLYIWTPFAPIDVSHWFDKIGGRK